jgi:Ca2+-binding EF-hand superfamily protein
MRKYGAGVFGRTSTAALEQFLLHPEPGLVLDVRLGRSPRRDSTLALAAPEEIAGPLAAQVQKTDDGDLLLNLDGIEVRLGLDDNVRDFRKFFAMRFGEADADQDGTLDRKEAEKSRSFRQVFGPADRNSDEKLARSEMTAYLDRVVDATESRLMVTPSDLGRNVFAALDTNRDRRLGRRELRHAAKQLKGLDHDGDGRVGLAELPRLYELRVGRGPSFRRRGGDFESDDAPSGRSAGAREAALSWFRHMDRNHDGDVSPGEFLGTPDDFRRLDADADGLIDPSEAAKGP